MPWRERTSAPTIARTRIATPPPNDVTDVTGLNVSYVSGRTSPIIERLLSFAPKDTWREPGSPGHVPR